MIYRPFVSVDFETADEGRDSACALALVEVGRGKITASHSFLIRPPRTRFSFTHIHKLSYKDVAASPSFEQLWPTLAPIFARGDFLAAHNAPFDCSVLAACCAAAGVDAPEQPWLCTLALSRKAFGLAKNSLDVVCRHLSIPLDHHDALSDAEGCAQVALRAGEHARQAVQGLGLPWDPEEALATAPSLLALRQAGEHVAREALTEEQRAPLRALYRARQAELRARQGVSVHLGSRGEVAR